MVRRVRRLGDATVVGAVITLLMIAIYHGRKQLRSFLRKGRECLNRRGSRVKGNRHWRRLRRIRRPISNGDIRIEYDTRYSRRDIC